MSADRADGPAGAGPGPAAGPRGLSVSLRVNLNTMAIGAAVRPDPYPLSELVAQLPPGAAELLGWVPGIAVREFGFAFDPLRGGASVYVDAGLDEPAARGARLLLGTAAGPRRPFLLGVELDATIELGAVPLFGEALRGIGISDLSVSYASAPIAEQDIVRPPRAPLHPGGYTQGPQLALVVSDGTSREVLRLAPGSGQRTAPAAGSATSPMSVASAAAAVPGSPPVQWFAVQKRIGPLTLRRIGVVTRANAFGLALDASLRTAALSVDLAGFVVMFDPRSDISPRTLRVALDGLSVAFASGALRLDATLTRVELPTASVATAAGPAAGPAYEYAGSALVQAGPYSLSAVGAFAELEGKPSMFVFGVARGRFGGVPAFFVTGLAVGFGYQRGLRLPDSTEVLDFPLIRAALGGSRFAPPPPPGETLAQLRDGGWVPPLRDSHWFALGVAFNSFGIVDGFVLLLARFGDRLQFALLGVASIRLPKIGPTYAYVELTIDAVLDPMEGTFRVGARLTPNSFVIDRGGRIEGGFAAWLWFGDNPLAGDFAITLGGYHPAFDRPDWYPTVPRLGLSWRASKELQVAGEAYFALTPSGVMAGGNLAMTFQAGPLHAWFTARADFLMFWDPLFFNASIRVGIGASYTLSLGSIRRTLTVELGAELALWGPPFAGIARVRWAVISFTVTVNGGVRPPRPAPVIDWQSFETGFLPAPSPDPDHGGDQAQSNVCRPRAANGLLGTVLLEGRTHWLVDTGGFVLMTETAVPASAVVVEGPDARSTLRFDGPAVGVYPMGGLPVATGHRVRLARPTADGRPGPPEDLTAWDWAPVTGDAPYALWGTQNTGAPRLEGSVVPAMLGVLGTPRGVAPAGPPPVPVVALGVEEVKPRRPLPLPFGPPIDGGTSRPSIDPREIIRDTVVETRGVRDEIAGALVLAGIGSALTGGGLKLLADQAFTAFAAPPMIGEPGSTGPVESAAAAADGGTGPEASSGSAGPRPDKARPGRARPVRPLPGGRTAGPNAVFYQGSGGSAADGRAPTARRVSAHLIDHSSTNVQRGFALRHTGFGSGRGAARLAPGTTLTWRLPPAAYAAVDADGAAPLWIVAFDAQSRPVGIALLGAGSASRFPIPRTAEVLAISALSSAPSRRGGPNGSGGASGSGSAPSLGGWTPMTPLLHVTPQAFLAEGAIVRAQAPIRLRRSAQDGSPGLLSGYELAERNRVKTLGGIVPGGLRAWLPGAAAAVTVAVRRDPGSAERAGSDPALDLSVGEAAGIRPITAWTEADLSAGQNDVGHRWLRYPIDGAGAGDGAGDGVGDGAGAEWTCVSVRPEPGWLVEGVLGDRPLREVGMAGAAGATGVDGAEFTEVVFS